MSLTLALACAWVVAATVVAFLPMRLQVPLGLVLLVAAAVLIVRLALETNVWLVLAAVAAVVSMFRKPLRYFMKRAIMKLAPDGEGREP